MGNTQNWVTTDASFPSEQQLLTSMVPIDDVENNNTLLGEGRFKIYRFKTEPYEIVMKHVRTFTPHSPRFEQFEEAAKIAARLDHKNIAKIHSVNICRRRNICTEQVSIESYINYYTLDLQRVIEERKKMDHRFLAGQIWYIINSLVDLALYLQKFGIVFGMFTPSNICLSPQGYIKVYLHHCTPKNKHSLYYHIIGNDSRDIHKYLPIPPECLSFLRKKAMNINQIHSEPMEVFGIAITALQAMIYNTTRRYYLHESQLQLNFDQKQLKQDLLQLKQVYPHCLISLLEKMLKSNPEDRPTLLQIQKNIKQVREQISINGAIQIIEEEQQNKVQKFSYKKGSKDCREILKTITSRTNKLQCFPLKSVSKDKYSSCRSQYHPLEISQASTKHKLQLSSLSVTRALSRRQGKTDIRLLSSFR